MRVLVLAGEWFPDWKGGNARAVTSASRALAEQGHEVTVLAPSRMNGPCVTTEGSLTVRHAIRRGRLPVTFSDFIAGLRQGPRLRSEQFDVIFGDALTRICGVLRRGIDTPLVLLYHAPTPQELRFERPHLPLP